MRKRDGRFKKGERRSPATEFKMGTHWRSQKPYWEKEWLRHEYEDLGRSAGDISTQFNVTDTAIHFWLKKHSIVSRTVSEARNLKHWGLSGSDNPMWNKRGELNPRWLGGVTPERQAFYTSNSWKKACSDVWKRDNATCQRCFLRKQDNADMPMHIHHIVSFAVAELRADTSNLILLCESCHHFIHSLKNVKGEFLQQRRDS